MPKSLRSCVLAVVGAALTSCGTLMTPATFEVPVTSVPAGADVVRDGVVVAKTPCAVTVTRERPDFELRLEGHRPCAVECGTVPNPWFLANVTTLGAGMPVDLVLGSDRNPDTAPVQVQLTKAADGRTTTWRRDYASTPAAPAAPAAHTRRRNGAAAIAHYLLRRYIDPDY